MTFPIRECYRTVIERLQFILEKFKLAETISVESNVANVTNIIKSDCPKQSSICVS